MTRKDDLRIAEDSGRQDFETSRRNHVEHIVALCCNGVGLDWTWPRLAHSSDKSNLINTLHKLVPISLGLSLGL